MIIGPMESLKAETRGGGAQEGISPGAPNEDFVCLLASMFSTVLLQSSCLGYGKA